MTMFLALLLSGISVTMVNDAKQERPVVLQTVQVGDQIQIAVIGQAREKTSVSYRLETSSGSSANANHSVQSGAATLDPDRPVTMLVVRLGNAADCSWTARLYVKVADGNFYDIVESGRQNSCPS